MERTVTDDPCVPGLSLSRLGRHQGDLPTGALYVNANEFIDALLSKLRIELEKSGD
jgi:hypothetical protein